MSKKIIIIDFIFISKEWCKSHLKYERTVADTSWSVASKTVRKIASGKSWESFDLHLFSLPSIIFDILDKLLNRNKAVVSVNNSAKPNWTRRTSLWNYARCWRKYPLRKHPLADWNAMYLLGVELNSCLATRGC